MTAFRTRPHMRRILAVLGLCIAVLVSPHLAALNADAGRVFILDAGEHRVIAVDRQSRAVISENTDFVSGDCLVQLSPEDLVVCDRSEFVHVGLDLRERKRAPTSFGRVSSIRALGSDKLLVSDTDRHAVISIDRLGNELSSMMFHHPVDVLPMTKDWFVIADGTAFLKVFDLNGTVVRQMRLPQWVASLDVARDTGDILIGESSGYARLTPLLHQLWFRPSKSRVTCIQDMPAGEILLCEPDLHRVVIVDRDGTIVWEFSNLNHPWRALYIP